MSIISCIWNIIPQKILQLQQWDNYNLNSSHHAITMSFYLFLITFSFIIIAYQRYGIDSILNMQNWKKQNDSTTEMSLKIKYYHQ